MNRMYRIIRQSYSKSIVSLAVTKLWILFYFIRSTSLHMSSFMFFASRHPPKLVGHPEMLIVVIPVSLH
jgi:hypothetical protein